MKVRVISGAVAVFCLLLLLTVLYTETLYAKRAAVMAIQPNMTRLHVVESLGVLYDGYKPGEYEDVDQVIARMRNSHLITYICCWRVAHSRNRYWVGFDKDDDVVATHLEANLP